MDDCLFCKIRDGIIPAKIIAENVHGFAFHDIHPQAPTHVLVVPRRHLVSLGEADDNDAVLLGELQLMARRIAHAEGLDGGFRTVLNTGRDAGQSVFHLHLHLLGGRALGWPPG